MQEDHQSCAVGFTSVAEILKESRGAPPPQITNSTQLTNSLTFKPMTELNTQAQITELTDEQLELVEGGGKARVIFKIAKHAAPFVIDWLTRK